MRSDIQQDPVEQLGSLETELHSTAGDLVKLKPQRVNKYSSAFQENPLEYPRSIPSGGSYACRRWKAIKAGIGE